MIANFMTRSMFWCASLFAEITFRTKDLIMKLHKPIIMTLALATILSSCGMKQQLDEMHDSTVGMNSTTTEMSETTKDLAQLTEGMSYTTEELNEMTAALLPLARTGGTAAIRNRRVEAMNNPIFALNIEHKILHAGVYWQGFEFQAWTNTVTDDQYTKMNFYADAIEEFALTLDSNISAAKIDVKELDKINPATDQNEELNIFAFAVSSHKVLMYQDYLARRIPTFTKVSFLDIIQAALAKEKSYNDSLTDGSELFRYEHLALRNAEKLKYLLHARYNMLATIALARINNIDRVGFTVKARYFLKKWTARLSRKTRAEQEEVIEYMTMANETKNFIEAIGEKSVLNKNIKKIIKNMRVDVTESKDCQTQCINNSKKIKELATSLLK